MLSWFLLISPPSPWASQGVGGVVLVTRRKGAKIFWVKIVFLFCVDCSAVLPDNYCVNRPTEIVQSNKEYTEDDVTDEVMKGMSTLGSSNVRPFDLPGLRSDIEAIEHSISEGINRFFEAADEMRNDFFRVFNDSSLFGRDSSSSSRRRIIPFEDDIQGKPDAKANGSDSGSLDIPSLARDV